MAAINSWDSTAAADLFREPLELLEASSRHQRVSLRAPEFPSLPDFHQRTESPCRQLRGEFLWSLAALLHPPRLVFPEWLVPQSLSVQVQTHQLLSLLPHLQLRELCLRLLLTQRRLLPARALPLVVLP